MTTYGKTEITKNDMLYMDKKKQKTGKNTDCNLISESL